MDINIYLFGSILEPNPNFMEELQGDKLFGDELGCDKLVQCHMNDVNKGARDNRQTLLTDFPWWSGNMDFFFNK